MARVKLYDYECEENLLPDICMSCGADSTARVKRRFRWHPNELMLTALAGLIVYFILIPIFQRKMVVNVPLCDRHSGYWKRRRRRLILAIFFPLVFIVSSVAIMYFADLGKNDIMMMVILFGFLASLIGFFVAYFLIARGLFRVSRITDRAITILKVQEIFAEELDYLRLQRAADEEPDREPRKNRRRDTDYDDHED